MARPGRGATPKQGRRPCLAVWLAPRPSMPLERNQRVTIHAVAFESPQSPELGQIDDERCADNLSARQAYELRGGLGRAARRDQVIHQQDTLTLADRVLVDLDGIDAVFER